ncbi:hypothetical protein L6452_40604 [Arctium lappa]|uniref:Uncharacterized protein n=1 Tax=Arctium lappa TaxID=4217 RepID=A0ACB8XMX7_ARCLA|nr:hypothetical protein L6452_40604 [Arctium lappa]
MPPSRDTKTTSPSQKGESVALRVHLPQDTSLSHTEVFVTSITHKSDIQTISELMVREHDDSVVLEQPQNPFNIDFKGVSKPSLKERVDRTSIGASTVEHRGLEGNPPELIIKTGSESAKDLLAKSGTCVVPELDLSRESKANSQNLTEALKANTKALQALSTNCAKRDDLQACRQAIIAHSHQIQVLGDLCTEEFPKYASTGVQTGVIEMGRLREEIKNITRKDAIKKITDHVDNNLGTPKKRKEPVSCQTQAGQKRARHEDQDPDASGHGPHEGENLQSTKEAPLSVVKPEEEDWAFDLQPLSELPILQPFVTPSEDRVAEVIQGFKSLRKPFPVPPKKDIEEEVYKYLYSRGAQDLPTIRLSEEAITEERRRFYKDKAKPKSKVFSMAKITEVVAIKLGHTKCKNFLFSEYTVKREDTNIWTFTDADLPNLHPHDLPELFKWTEDKFGWKKEHQEAHLTIKRVMREKLLFYSIANSQVALDLGVKKVNFPPPEDNLPSSANILPNSITTSPSFGFVYLNLKGEKKLFIGMESQKYSTESLLLIQDLLIKHRGTPLVPAEAADTLLKNIGATLNIRDLCVCYYRELKKKGGFGKKINDFTDAKAKYGNCISLPLNTQIHHRRCKAWRLPRRRSIRIEPEWYLDYRASVITHRASVKANLWRSAVEVFLRVQDKTTCRTRETCCTTILKIKVMGVPRCLLYRWQSVYGMSVLVLLLKILVEFLFKTEEHARFKIRTREEHARYKTCKKERTRRMKTFGVFVVLASIIKKREKEIKMKDREITNLQSKLKTTEQRTSELKAELVGLHSKFKAFEDKISALETKNVYLIKSLSADKEKANLEKVYNQKQFDLSKKALQEKKDLEHRCLKLSKQVSEFEKILITERDTFGKERKVLDDKVVEFSKQIFVLQDLLDKEGKIFQEKKKSFEAEKKISEKRNVGIFKEISEKNKNMETDFEQQRQNFENEISKLSKRLYVLSLDILKEQKTDQMVWVVKGSLDGKVVQKSSASTSKAKRNRADKVSKRTRCVMQVITSRTSLLAQSVEYAPFGMRVLTSSIAKDARSMKHAHSIMRVLTSCMTLLASFSSFHHIAQIVSCAKYTHYLSFDLRQVLFIWFVRSEQSTQIVPRVNMTLEYIFEVFSVQVHFSQTTLCFLDLDFGFCSNLWTIDIFRTVGLI